MPVNPEMLILAREAEGLTVRVLADKLSVNHSTLSRYESGLVPVPDSFAEMMADALNRPASYFYRPGKRYDSSGNYHRKRATMSVRSLKMIHARINEIRLQAAALLEWAEVETENDFYRLDQSKYGGPEGVARELRRLWQLPSGPIHDVTNAIEGAGGVVFGCDFETGAIDGVSQWPLDDESMPPIFFISENIPGDRWRFTLCHELAHVVMHHLPSPELEPEADRFASEFLMPANEIRDELKGITIEKAAELKSRWKVAMSALIRRAKDLKVISESQYTNMIKRMSMLGYLKCEPVPIPRERTELFDAVFDVNRVQIGRSDDEMCDLLGITHDTLAAKYGRGGSGLRLRFGT